MLKSGDSEEILFICFWLAEAVIINLFGDGRKEKHGFLKIS